MVIIATLTLLILKLTGIMTGSWLWLGLPIILWLIMILTHRLLGHRRSAFARHRRFAKMMHKRFHDQYPFAK